MEAVSLDEDTRVHEENMGYLAEANKKTLFSLETKVTERSKN